MTYLNPTLIDVPEPIRTRRLLIRPRQFQDGGSTALAIAETWQELHLWTPWAEEALQHTPEHQEIVNRKMMASFLLREELSFICFEHGMGPPIMWCSFHTLNWPAGTCEIAFWVRKASHRKGFATEALSALTRYAFSALRMRRIGISHARGNLACNGLLEKLGYKFVGVETEAANLPGNRLLDRLIYTRLDAHGLPDTQVCWPES